MMIRPEGVYAITPTVHLNVLQAETAGATVLIQGGIHGDEKTTSQ